MFNVHNGQNVTETFTAVRNDIQPWIRMFKKDRLYLILGGY